MVRPLRIDVEGGWYHVMSRGTERRTIFVDDRYHEHFLELLGEMRERYEIEIHAFVLMGNHYHLVIRTPRANTSRAMQWLNTSFSAWFNRRRQRVGHVLQGRFKSVLIENQGQWLLEASAYVHLNPIRTASYGLSKAQRKREGRGVVRPTRQQIEQRLRAIRGHRWSSYPVYAGYRHGPAWLQTDVILKRAGGCAAYRRLIQCRVTQGEDPESFMTLAEGVVLGGRAFLERARRLAGGQSAETGNKAFLRPKISFPVVVRVVEGVKGEVWSQFEKRYGDEGRDLAFYLARRRSGMTLAEIGAAAGGVDSRAVGQAVSRFGKRLVEDKGLLRLANRCLKELSNIKM